MATNKQIATSLRALAEAADDDLAQHDLNTLADALEPAKEFGELYPEVDVDANELVRELEGVDDRRDAMAYVSEHNNFEHGAVIDSEDNIDVDCELYVYAPDTRVADVDAPDGWYARNVKDGEGIGFDRK
jgi:hypothetical protein